MDGKATAIEVGNSVFVKNRKLEWSENTNVNRSVAMGGVSQGPAALGNNVDLDSIASMFDDMIASNNYTQLDNGDGRLMATQQSTRSLTGMQQSHTGRIYGIPNPALVEGIWFVLRNGNEMVLKYFKNTIGFPQHEF